MCRTQCMGVIPCHTSRAHNTHPRNRSSTIDFLYVLLCHSAWVSYHIIPAERNQGSHHSPEESILDHRFSLCVAQCMGATPAERNQCSHHSPQNSIIDSLYYVSQCTGVILAEAERHQGSQTLTRGIDHRFSLLCVTVQGCHTSRTEPGLANTHPMN